MSTGIVIVGAGHAGATVATGLAQAGYEGPITLIGEEHYAPYLRPPLSKGFIKGDTRMQSLLIKPEAYYAQKNIRLIKGRRVNVIRPDIRCVQLDNSERIAYQSLVLCTGSRPRTLPVKGAELEHVYNLRGIDDAMNIAKALPENGRIVIIGAGYIGLELAASCIAMGLDVTLLEAADRVMARSASAEISGFYQVRHLAAGVNLITGVRVVALDGDEQVQLVHAEDGRCWPADVVVIGVGAVPDTELAEAADINCDDGILVDAECRSSDKYIYAAGDCTRQIHVQVQQSLRLESVQNASAQARMIVSRLMGKAPPPVEVPWFWSDQFDLRLQIAGIVRPGYRTLLRGDPELGCFSVLHLQQGRLQALEAVNRPMDFTLGKRLINEQLLLDESSVLDEKIPLYPPPQVKQALAE
ncbi:MAG: FAD-dependent oxidoreductase [Gammaproteobacteria bacterium]|nr:FAD-dependent oxidoreductase [Gammaproteobacteria bacterium]